MKHLNLLLFLFSSSVAMAQTPVMKWDFDTIENGEAIESSTSIADTIENAIKNGISEHYDSISGRPLGVPDYSMSSTLVSMMLDGLTRNCQLKLRDGDCGS